MTAWIGLATQFCLELAFGVLLGLCFLARAPLGLFFHRLMAATAAMPLLAAALLGPLWGGERWNTPVVLSSGAALLALPVLAAGLRSDRRRLALVVATVASAVALAFSVRGAPGLEGDLGWTLGSLSAMATGGVAGGVGLAMVVGHWYLTIPELPVAILQRLNRYTAVAMLVSAALLAASCALHADALAQARPPLLGPRGLFHLAARVSVGIALPLLFAAMAANSLRYRNTRSATGILYASTVLVLIGAAVSLSLQDSYGIPL